MSPVYPVFPVSNVPLAHPPASGACFNIVKDHLFCRLYRIFKRFVHWKSLWNDLYLSNPFESTQKSLFFDQQNSPLASSDVLASSIGSDPEFDANFSNLSANSGTRTGVLAAAVEMVKKKTKNSFIIHWNRLFNSHIRHMAGYNGKCSHSGRGC